MNEQTRIYNDRREIDLLSVLSTDKQKVVLQAETKANVIDTSDSYIRKDIRKGIEQLEHFKNYLERMHGAEVKNFWYSPAVGLPNLSVCFCNPGKCVTEIEISQNQTSDGASLDQAYQGRKYQVCPIRIRGHGCGFFKWEGDLSPDPQCDLDGASSCACGKQPITIEVPLPESKKAKGGPPKRFHVCENNGCNFFRWFDQPQKSKKDQTFGNSCTKHFILKEHIMNQEKQKVWWNENCRMPPGHGDSGKPQIDSLKGRLLTVASMAFTRIPRLLSRDTPDSMLILMRQVLT